jgi:hypothetical protein
MNYDRRFDRGSDGPEKEEEPSLFAGIAAIAGMVLIFAIASGQFSEVDFDKIREGIGFFFRGGLAFGVMLFIYWNLLKTPEGIRPTSSTTPSWAFLTIVVTVVAALWPKIQAFSLDSFLSSLLKM